MNPPKTEIGIDLDWLFNPKLDYTTTYKDYPTIELFGFPDESLNETETDEPESSTDTKPLAKKTHILTLPLLVKRQASQSAIAAFTDNLSIIEPSNIEAFTENLSTIEPSNIKTFTEILQLLSLLPPQSMRMQPSLCKSNQEYTKQ